MTKYKPEPERYEGPAIRCSACGELLERSETYLTFGESAYHAREACKNTRIGDIEKARTAGADRVERSGPAMTQPKLSMPPAPEVDAKRVERKDANDFEIRRDVLPEGTVLHSRVSATSQKFEQVLVAHQKPLDGLKYDQNKTQYNLIPPRSLEAWARVMTFGAKKYGPNNWKLVDDHRARYFGALCRHIWAWWRGELRDPESGEHHLAHAMCCLGFLLEVDLEGESK